MMTADLALALLINRTSSTIRRNPPLYMSYTEHTHVSAPRLGRAQEHQPLGRRARRRQLCGDAGPTQRRAAYRAGLPDHRRLRSVLGLHFGYFANLKRVDITLKQGEPYLSAIPQPDPSVNVVVPYNSYLGGQYAPDSTDAALHLLIDADAALPRGLYPVEVVEDPNAAAVAYRNARRRRRRNFSLDYKVIEGHWVIVHGTFSPTAQVAFMTFKVVADVRISNIAFPSSPRSAPRGNADAISHAHLNVPVTDAPVHDGDGAGRGSCGSSLSSSCAGCPTPFFDGRSFGATHM